jgi:carbohydrate-binding DOMON domain-containing protein
MKCSLSVAFPDTLTRRSTLWYNLAIVRKLYFLTLILLSLAVSSALAGEEVIVSLGDPIGDDYGPGYYVYPSNSLFTPGSFDIVSFEVSRINSNVRFKIRFKNKFFSPPKDIKGGLPSNLFLQNIDIYMDKDHKRGSGRPKALPGRGANIASESFWEQAVLITPLPKEASKSLKQISPGIASSVIIPGNFSVYRDTILFSVSTREIGEPKPWWGYLVMVTPANFTFDEPREKSYFGLGESGEDLLLMLKVRDKRTEWNFGGGDPSGVS